MHVYDKYFVYKSDKLQLKPKFINNNTEKVLPLNQHDRDYVYTINKILNN